MTTIIILLVVAIVILIVLVAWLVLRNQKQSDELKEKNKVIVREVERRSVLEGRMLALLFVCCIGFTFTQTVSAQDFQLYYAKNVTDVTSFDDMAKMDKQLSWRQVTDGSIDGNWDDVNKVKEMLASTRMKGLEDQQLFWKMRDEMLLCFRIDDTQSNGGSFCVEVNYGKDYDGNDKLLTLNTSKYFFANMPLACDSVTINVWRRKDPTQRIRFRYWVYDWDDDDVYIFQLDQKRQSTGDTYKMEYVTSYMDEEGEVRSESNILELKETKFQSFYVPKGHSLTDIYFLTGNIYEGDVKLQLDMNDIHPNIDIDNQLEVPNLSTKFNLAKHENRELMNFNWIGTGLFEKYDTLFIKLFNDRGKEVKDAEMHVHRVDEDGYKVPDNTLKYLGYDSDDKYFKVLTYAHPAYVEILVDGYLPMVYRYKGAADRTSRVVSADLCSARITLRSGDADDGGIAISNQYFRYLEDQAIAVMRGDVAYDIVTLKEEDISGKLASEVVSFADDGGNNYPKLLDNKPVEHLAHFELVFSSPKGGRQPQCNLTATETLTQQTHEVEALETRVVSAKEFTNFTRDYYFVRYDVGNALPYNQECRLTLSTQTATYEEFPAFINIQDDPEKRKEETNAETEENISPKVSNEDVGGATADCTFGLQLPADFKFSLPGGVSIKTGTLMNFRKQTLDIYTNIAVGKNNEGDEDSKDRLKAARNNAKEVTAWRSEKIYQKGDDKDPNKKTASISAADPKIKFEDWVVQEMESIFSVSALHIGWYVGGGAKLALAMPLAYLAIPQPQKTQITEVSGYLEGGWGIFWTPTKLTGVFKTIQEYLEEVPKAFQCKLDIGLVADINARLDFGIKSYGKVEKYEWSSEDKGFFTNLTVTARAGAWLGVITPKCPAVNLEAGVRAGMKLQAAGGLMVPFCKEPTQFGLRLMACAGAEAYVTFRSFIFDWSARAALRGGTEYLNPDDKSNPFHRYFPYWLPDPDSSRSLIGNRFKRMPALEPTSLGRPLLNDVFYDANPHFLSSDRVVFNDLGNANDYNDDHVTMATLSDDASVQNGSAALNDVVSTESLSVPGTQAGQHKRSKRGEHEIVVYRQTAQKVDNSAVTDETASELDNLMHLHSQIKASIRQSDGTWRHTEVTADDGFVDQNPAVTIQDDGKAAVIYEHGTLDSGDGQSGDADMGSTLVGQLMMRTYTPDGGWSSPTALWDINDTKRPIQYDLIMRNDTVLVGAMLNDTNAPLESFAGAYRMQYASAALSTVAGNQTQHTVKYVDEDLHPVDFFMSRAGQHGVVAMIYEKSDSTREVYFKTVNMDGYSDGLTGGDLGVGNSKPYKIKIISDRSSADTEDFALLWTEQSHVVRDAENGNVGLKDQLTLLNATRIHMSQSPALTYPLTVGAERDSLIMTDFDGYLDDARIKVVYTLTDAVTHASVVMVNEKEFTNSFESDVTYSRFTLDSSNILPVNVYIKNTGTSAIKAGKVTINNQTFNIEDCYVPPLTEKTFVVQYPIPDNFDGYIQSSVTVEYDNVFKASSQKGFRATARNLRTQSLKMARKRVLAGHIDCNVVSRHVKDGVNTFVIEVIDYSSRGLTPGTGVEVGIFPHPSAIDLLSEDAQTIVRSSDFRRIGGVRKAYAEIVIPGVTEPIDGYIVPHIVDLQANDASEKGVENLHRGNHVCYVALLPSGSPTSITRPVESLPEDHHVSVTAQDGGVLLNGLSSGDEVRVFSSAGWTIYLGHASGTSHFVPLRRHDTYILCAGDEVFKFNY